MHSYIIQASFTSALEVINSLSPLAVDQPHADLYRAEPELSIGIEQVREVKHFLTTPPFQGDYKVILILQAETLTPEAQNAFLKTLEEPPEYARLFLVTEHPDQLLPTILSRCQLVQTPQASQSPIDLTETKQVITQLQTSSIAEKVNQAARYTKRDQAVALCRNLTHYYRSLLPQVAALHNLKLLEKSLKYLQANTNPQLTTESLFLQLRA